MNPGCELDLGWVNNSRVNLYTVKDIAAHFQDSRILEGKYETAWQLRALTCIDLTTLAGDDTDSNVSRLCCKANTPLSSHIVNLLGFDYDEADCPVKTAAVCVYPAKVGIAVKTLRRLGANNINVASVATGFPSGQVPLHTRLAEIEFAVEQGATEIDVVINRSLALTGKWAELYREIKSMKKACGEAHMKTILATGELGTLTNVYKASLVAMMAGSDFIKTSTGKEALNATIPFGIVMCRAIRDYYKKMGYKVGLKPAGGIRSASEAVSWLILVREELGVEWCYPNLFRIGASGLLGDIEKELYHSCTSKYAAAHEFDMA